MNKHSIIYEPMVAALFHPEILPNPLENLKKDLDLEFTHRLSSAIAFLGLSAAGISFWHYLETTYYRDDLPLIGRISTLFVSSSAAIVSAYFLKMFCKNIDRVFELRAIRAESEKLEWIFDEEEGFPAKASRIKEIARRDILPLHQRIVIEKLIEKAEQTLRYTLRNPSRFSHLFRIGSLIPSGIATDPDLERAVHDIMSNLLRRYRLKMTEKRFPQGWKKEQLRHVIRVAKGEPLFLIPGDRIIFERYIDALCEEVEVMVEVLETDP